MIQQHEIDFIGNHIATHEPELAKQILKNYKQISRERISAMWEDQNFPDRCFGEQSDKLSAFMYVCHMLSPGRGTEMFLSRLSGLCFKAINKRIRQARLRVQVDNYFKSLVNNMINEA